MTPISTSTVSLPPLAEAPFLMGDTQSVEFSGRQIRPTVTFSSASLGLRTQPGLHNTFA